MEWQPIETAPKDETHFLAIRHAPGFAHLPNAICWNPWIGNFAADAGPGATTPVKHQPTHWMPIPEAPK
ncbi:MAG: DUF551 domain-containing protein [Acetobacteraceae bacterium]|nr:DUF551 domain-containing protein [Acetobacteraceae bacterium]